jgi:hypothetical protein
MTKRQNPYIIDPIKVKKKRGKIVTLTNPLSTCGSLRLPKIKGPIFREID